MKRYISLTLTAAMLLAACGQGNDTTTAARTASDTTTSTPAKDNGKQLFASNCAQCHGMKQDKLAPKLEGVFTRWNNDSAAIAVFVKNSQAVINGGKSVYATNLYHTWSNGMMPAFTNLKDDEIAQILHYLHEGVE